MKRQELFEALAAPAAVRLGRSGQPLADLDTRFRGALVDHLAALVVWMANMTLALPGFGLAFSNPADAGAINLVGLVAALPFAALQWQRVTATGQTIGKQLVGAKIVRLDGGEVGFYRGVVLRSWVMALPNMFVPLAILNLLFVFRGDRRCVHDLLAGTEVIRVPRHAD